jgi:hypothetical protein
MLLLLLLLLLLLQLFLILFLKFIFKIASLSTLFRASVSNQNFSDDFLFDFDLFSWPFLSAYNGLP